MASAAVPSRLYRVYWAGRYVERIDLLARSLDAAIRAFLETGSEAPLARLAAGLGLEYGGLRELAERVLYDERGPSSVLHAARMIRVNLQGLGVERLLREANMLVLTAENRVDTGSPESLMRHLEDLISAVNRLGRVLEEELTAPPTPPESVLREQLLHQQQ